MLLSDYLACRHANGAFHEHGSCHHWRPQDDLSPFRWDEPVKAMYESHPICVAQGDYIVQDSLLQNLLQALPLMHVRQSCALFYMSQPPSQVLYLSFEVSCSLA